MKYIIGIAAAVVVIGGGAYFVMQGGSQQPATGDAMEQKEAKEVPSNFTGSIGALIALGAPATCTFSYTYQGATVDGTVYVAQEKMRGDFTMSQQGQSFDVSVIRDGSTHYTWGATPFGAFATKVDLDNATPAEKEKSGVDFDEDLDYTCAPWRVDASMFALPSDVNFDDINAEVQQIQAAEQMVGDLKCSACDSIPDANAKAQCLAAIGC